MAWRMVSGTLGMALGRALDMVLDTALGTAMDTALGTALHLDMGHFHTGQHPQRLRHLMTNLPKLK
jgi:hypothetical protein